MTSTRNIAPEQIPTRSSLRGLLQKVLSLGELDSFAIDYFPNTHRRYFGSEMPPEQKINWLLSEESPLEILNRLRRAHPDKCARHQKLLEFGSPSLFRDRTREYLHSHLETLQRDQDGYLERSIVSFNQQSSVHLPQDFRRRRIFLASLIGSHRELAADEILKEGRVLILGDAGSGKSMFLRQAFAGAVDRHLKDPSAPFPILVDLKLDLEINRDLRAALDTKSQGLYSLLHEEHAGTVVLFMDNLDALLLDTPALMNNLVALLNHLDQTLENRLVSVLLACRRAVWEEHPKENQEKLTSRQRFGLCSADHGAERLWLQVLSDARQQAKFLALCRRAQIEPLLTSPYYAVPLARRFLKHERIGDSRIANLELFVRDDLERATRDDSVPHGSRPSLPRLQEMASALAFMSIFSNVASFTIEQAREMLVLAFNTEFTVPQTRSLLFSRLFTCGQSAYSFRHQIPYEFLAAQVLAKLSIRNQLSLLCGGKYRGPLLPRYRSVALMLAQINRRFFIELRVREPMLALVCAEGLAQDEAEQLLHAAFEQGIARYHTPWMPVAFSGEEPQWAFARFRPVDVKKFLTPYFQRRHPVAIRWALTSLIAWDGDDCFTKRLLTLAQDKTQEEFVRRQAVHAIGTWLSSGNKKALGSDEVLAVIKELIGCDLDDVRASALAVHYELKIVLPPEELSRLLRGGPRNHRVRGGLYSAARLYPQVLNKRQMTAFFDHIAKERESLGALYMQLVQGWLLRAKALGPDLLTFNRFKQIVVSRRFVDGVDINGDLRSYLLAYRKNYKVLLDACLAEIGAGDPLHLRYYMRQALASAAQDDLLDMLPADTHGLTQEQIQFIRSLLSHLFYQNATEEILSLFRQRVPEFSQDLQVPEVPQSHLQVEELLHAASQSPVEKVRGIIALANDSRSSSHDKVVNLHVFIEKLPDELKRQVAILLQEFIRYGAQDEHQHGVMDSIVLPYLCEMSSIRNEVVLLDLVKRHDFEWWLSKTPLLKKLLELMRSADAKRECSRHLQQQCLPWINAVVTSQARQNEIFQLINYLECIGHPHLRRILKRVSFLVKGVEPLQTFVMRKRMQCCDAEAWEEFSLLLESGMLVPDYESMELLGPFKNGRKLRPRWIRLLVEWYVLVKRQRTDEFGGIGDDIMALLRQIGGRVVCVELRRIINGNKFPGVRWLNATLSELELRLTTGKKEFFPIGTIAAHYRKTQPSLLRVA